MFTRDYVLNGAGYGPVGDLLEQVRFDPGYLRPYIEDRADHPYRGRPCVLVNAGMMRDDNAPGGYTVKKRAFLIKDLEDRGIHSPVFNATTLRRSQWIHMQNEVLEVARPRLRFWNDVVARSPYGGFDGMANMTIEYEVMSDPGEAVRDMDAISDGRRDQPLFKIRSQPLPITHSDFFFSQRRLATSANKGMPVSTVMGRAAARRVAEVVEQVAIGTLDGIEYGTQTAGYGAHDGSSTEYGLISHPNVITVTTFTAPTAGGWVPDTTYNQILAALEQLHSRNFHGPYVIYHSTDWSQYINRVYSISGGNNPGDTLRTMLLKHEDIEDVKRLDYLGSPNSSDVFTIVIAQLDREHIQAVNPMDMTTIQWPTQGGLRQNWKVLMIQTLLIRYDYNGVVPVVVCTTA